jgi:hypothetical protein
MPTTLPSVRSNARLAVTPAWGGSGTLFALACIAVLGLAAAAILSVSMGVNLVDLNLDASDMTWLMGP